MAQRPAPVVQGPSQSMVAKMGNALGGTIYANMGLQTSSAEECVFCYSNMAAGERIVQLDCHKTHQFHETCYINYVTHIKASNN